MGSTMLGGSRFHSDRSGYHQNVNFSAIVDIFSDWGSDEEASEEMGSMKESRFYADRSGYHQGYHQNNELSETVEVSTDNVNVSFLG